LQDASKEGLKDKRDQVKAFKVSAFCACLANKVALCRTEFTRIFDIDPAFELTAAEAGHPSWGKVFTQAKTAWKLAQDKATRDAQAKAAKEPPPTASVPARKP